jgi:DHA1 family multidrug resistance protein-like MFS transporter
MTQTPDGARSPGTGGTGAVVIAIAIVAGFAELAYAVMNVSAMPVYLKWSMHYGEAGITAIATAFLFCEGVMKGPFGIIGDRVGRKRLMMAGPLLSACTALLTLLVKPHQWYFFVLLRAIDGLGAAALWPAALAMIADVVHEDQRSRAMSLFNVTYLVGISLGPVLGGAANDLTGMAMGRVAHAVSGKAPQFVTYGLEHATADPRQASFYLISVLFVITAVAAWLRIPSVQPAHHALPEAERHTASESLRMLVVSLRQVPSTMLMAFVTFFGVGQIMFIVKLFALAEFGVTETGFGALLLLPCLLIAAVSVPLGTIGDRVGKERAIRFGLGLCAFSVLSLIFIRSHWALVLGGSLIGIGFVIAFPAWMAYVSGACEPSQRGAVMGAVGTAQGVGAMLGAPMGGFLYEHSHLRIGFAPWVNGHYAPFLACGLLLVVAWIIALTAIKPQPAR